GPRRLSCRASRCFRAAAINSPGRVASCDLWLPRLRGFVQLVVEADVALSRCAPSGPRSLTSVVMQSQGQEHRGGKAAVEPWMADAGQQISMVASGQASCRE